MSRSMFLFAGSTARALPTIASNTSAFCPHADHSQSGFFALASEIYTQIKIKGAAMVSNFSVSISANARTSTTTFGTRVNGVNGNCSVSVGSTQTGVFSDTTNSDVLADGDLLNYRVTTGAGTNSHSISYAKITLDQQENRSYFVAYPGSAPSADTYCGLLASGLTSTETPARMNIYEATTFSNLRVNLLSNTRTSATIVYLRKNGANTSISLSLTASTTGAFEDASNIESFVAGDDANVFFDFAAGSGSFQVQMVQVAINSKNFILGFHRPSTNSSLHSSSSDAPMAGYFGGGSMPMNFYGECKNLHVRVNTNSMDAGSTVITRKNSQNGNLTLSFGAATTGEFEDVTNRDVFKRGDTMAIRYSNTATTGSINHGMVSIQCKELLIPKALIY